MKNFLSEGILPSEEHEARRIAAQAPLFTLVDGKKGGYKWCVVPSHVYQTILEENYSGLMVGHFSSEKLYKSLI